MNIKANAIKLFKEYILTPLFAGISATIVTALVTYINGLWIPIYDFLTNKTLLANYAIMIIAFVPVIILAVIIKFILPNLSLKKEIDGLIEACKEEGTASVHILAMKAIHIAKKLNDEELVTYLNNELKGYKDFKDLPKYRKIIGTPKAFSTYRGWEIVQFDNAENREACSLISVFDGIESLQKISLTITGYLSHAPHPKKKQKILDIMPDAEDYQIEFSANQIENILSTVKNHIFDWAVCYSK